MMLCPICSAHSHMFRIRREATYTARRRKCLGPEEHRYTTYEVSPEQFKMIKAAEEVERILSRIRATRAPE